MCELAPRSTQYGLIFTDPTGSPKARPEVAIERDARVAFARLFGNWTSTLSRRLSRGPAAGPELKPEVTHAREAPQARSADPPMIRKTGCGFLSGARLPQRLPIGLGRDAEAHEGRAVTLGDGSEHIFGQPARALTKDVPWALRTLGEPPTADDKPQGFATLAEALAS